VPARASHKIFGFFLVFSCRCQSTIAHDHSITAHDHTNHSTRSHHSQHFTTKHQITNQQHKILKNNTTQATMLLRLLTIVLLFAGDGDALLRGVRKQQDDKGMRRKLKMTDGGGGGGGGGTGNRDDDLCNAQAIEEKLAMFGISGQQLIDLTAAAVDDCIAQQEEAVRGDNCLCYDEAVGMSGINNIPGGGRRTLEALQMNRGLAVIDPGQYCKSNTDCTGVGEKCRVGPYVWTCASATAFPGSMPLCDDDDPTCDDIAIP
jgi:hypothetical protein